MRFSTKWNQSIFFVLFLIFGVCSHLAYGVEISDFEDYKSNPMRIFLLANQDYQGRDMDLKHTIDDISVYQKIFGRLLKVPDNKIHVRVNLKLDEFIDWTKELSNIPLEKDEIIFFIFAGHGDKNGMPIFVDRKRISQDYFYRFVNGFTNDMVVIMDSCYSSAESTTSGAFSQSNDTVMVIGQDIVEPKKFRSNVLRIYSSLSNQASREGQFANVPSLKQYLGKVYSFLKKIGYNGKGNGIFTIAFASFFAEVDLLREKYTYQDVLEYVNFKFSQLKPFGLAQRARLLPWNSPFEDKQKYSILFINDEEKRKKRFLEQQKDEDRRKLYRKGIQLQNQEKYVQSNAVFQELIMEFSDYLDVNLKTADNYFYLAQKSIAELDMKQAESNLKNALRYYPNYAEAMYSMGNVMLAQNKLDQAKVYFNQLRTISEKGKFVTWSVISYNGLGKTALKQNQLKEAIRWFKKAVVKSKQQKLEVQQVNANNYLGMLYFKSDPAEALHFFERNHEIALKQDNRFVLMNSSNNLGLCWFKLKNYTKSAQYFSSALDILNDLKPKRPKDALMTRINLALSYQKLKQTNQALQLYEIVRATVDKNDTELNNKVLLNLISLYKEEKDYHRALFYVKELIAANKSVLSDKSNKETQSQKKLMLNARYEYADVQYRLGKIENAEKEWMKIYRIADQNNDKIIYVRSFIGLMKIYDDQIKSSFQFKDYPKAIKYSKRSIELYIELDNNVSLGRAYANLGYAHLQQNQLKLAYDNLKKSLQYTQQTNDVIGSHLVNQSLIVVLAKLSIQYHTNEDYVESLTYLLEILSLKKMEKSELVSLNDIQLLDKIMVTYALLDNPDKTWIFFEKKLEQILILSSNKLDVFQHYVETYLYIISIWLDKSNYSEAWRYIQSLWNYQNTVSKIVFNDPINLSMQVEVIEISYQFLNRLLSTEKQDVTIVERYQNLIALIDKMSNSRILQFYTVIYQDLVHIYLNKKDYQKALFYQNELLVKLKTINNDESLFNKENKKKIMIEKILMSISKA